MCFVRIKMKSCGSRLRIAAQVSILTHSYCFLLIFLKFQTAILAAELMRSTINAPSTAALVTNQKNDNSTSHFSTADVDELETTTTKISEYNDDHNIDYNVTSALDDADVSELFSNTTMVLDYDKMQVSNPPTASTSNQSSPQQDLSGEEKEERSLSSDAASANQNAKAADLLTENQTSSSSSGNSTLTSNNTREVDQLNYEPDSLIAADARRSGGWRDSRNARISDKVQVNATNIFKSLFKKKPYSKFWTVEQKWDDIFKRFMSIQGQIKEVMLKNFLRDIEYYADVTISPQCSEDLKFIQEYAKKSTNFRWLMHMFDSTGKSEPGMLTGNLANLGHVIQCIKVRAPSRPSNDTFEERFFEQQTDTLGERFRGKYCLASIRPVMPEKPRLISRFSDVLNISLLSNISYMGEPLKVLKLRATETFVPKSIYDLVDKQHNRLDQIPFESELFEYLINQRNFMFSLPRFIGVCYPSSCTKDDIRYSLQKTVDDQHQVVDIEFECEQEAQNSWEWFSTPRLISYVLIFLVVAISLIASLTRYILVDKLGLKKRLERERAKNDKLDSASGNSRLENLLATLDMLSMDKCAGILFIKTKPASPRIDDQKLENNRSTSIDALKGFLILTLIYSELVLLGCLPVPFMWSKWADSMFPFFRSLVTQIFLNTSIWTEAFYTISAYLIALKVLENFRPRITLSNNYYSHQCEALINAQKRLPDFASFIMKRYVRLVLPMAGFILLNYVWPRLSNGFVMQDQANKLMAPCDAYGWTNILLFHNHYNLNETCLWPTHVSATFFQLNIISYPIILLLLLSLRTRPVQPSWVATKDSSSNSGNKKLIAHGISTFLAATLLFAAIALGLIFPALIASQQELIVPFLIDYLDFDNYRRVLEWTLLPTYNHLASYMAGVALAYLVVGKRIGEEERKLATILECDNDWQKAGAYIHRENSLESVHSSSTQGLQWNKPTFKIDCDINQPVPPPPRFPNSRASSDSQRTSFYGNTDENEASSFCGLIKSLVLSCLAFGILFASLTSSWLWTGLGQPMTQNQTFWFCLMTKLAFNSAFAFIFYNHFATRRNSNDPWMITRFLVPIGRMSLTVFYVSWLVIWFDLLASLYQWHPSHYFIFEKYNEIIFMTLIFAMLAYGVFEGPVKRVQYRGRLEKVKQQQAKQTSFASGFEKFFEPLAEDEVEGEEVRMADVGGERKKSIATKGDKSDANEKTAAQQEQKQQHQRQQTGYSRHKRLGDVRSSALAGGHLTIADQYTLNAELRANYSFASIGLYESVGATDDLPNHQHQSSSSSSSASLANDLRVSLEPK